MRTYSTLFDELDVMKMQMQTLMNHIDCQSTISEDMIRRVCQKRAQEFRPSRMMVVISVLVCGIFLPLWFWSMALTDLLADSCSIPFAAFVHAMSWYSLFRGWQYSRIRLSETIANGTIVEVATKLAELQRKNSIHQFVTALFFLVFVVWYLIDNGMLLLVNLDHTIIMTLIFGLVGFSLIQRFSRIQHFATGMLRQIEELKR